MTTKTQRELVLEYWGRVYDMCDAYNKQHGTSIKPQKCVKLNGGLWKHAQHPMFDGREYDLAVAIIEDTPVFVGDKIYHKSMKHSVTIIEGAFYDCRYWTLTPPKPKRTFDINGKQLPCPSNNEFCDTYLLDIIGVNYYFESMEDRNIVARELLNIIADARDKE